MRLSTSLAIGTAVMLSASALAQDKNANAAKDNSKQTPSAPAAHESIINLKVTGMT